MKELTVGEMKVFLIVCQLASLFILNVIGKVKIILIVLVDKKSNFNFQRKTFFHYNVTQVLDSKFSNFSLIDPYCQVNTREAPCDFTPLVRWFVLSEIDRAFFQFRIVNTKTGKKFIDQHLNICTMQTQPGNIRDIISSANWKSLLGPFPGINIFARMYLDQLKECINFDIECPMRTVKTNFYTK